MLNATRLWILALAVAASPALLNAQKNEIIALQRDVAEMQDQIKQLQKSQDEKMAALTALVQQSLDASAKVSASLASMQKSLTDSLNASLNDQQSKLVAPVAVLNTKVDETSRDLVAVRETVADLSTRLNKMDTKINDIYTAVTSPPVLPPTVTPSTAAPATSTPAGVSAVSLRQDAERDMSGAKYVLALQEFADYIKNFHDDAYAPTAQYHIGEIYERNEQWDDAAQAFEAVVKQFPKNERTVDAAYYRAVDLQKGGHKRDAATEYRNFLKDYSSSDHAPAARRNLSTVEGTSSSTTHKKK